MNRIARTGVTGAALTLATLPLLPVVALAHEAPVPNKAQIEYQERVQAPLRLHYGVVADSHLTKAQIEYNERTSASTGSTSSQVSKPQTQLRIDSGDAAVWQLAVSAAAGALLTGGVVLTSRGMGRRRQALAS